jgi:hypothetical protein
MNKSSAERQRDFRQRVNAAAVRTLESELAHAAERRGQMDAVIAGLEAQLEQARSVSGRHSGTCGACGTALACPQCSRGDEWA